MRVLVTGGTGFIGTATRKELKARGHDPVIFDHHVRGSDPDPKYFGDIRDAVQVSEAVTHSDAVIHLAGVLGTAETVQKPEAAAMTNIVGGLNVLEAVTEFGVPLVNIGVGNWWMDNTYSISKNTVERFARMFARERGTNVVTVRALNAYGPGQSIARPYGPSNVRKITPSFICRALSGDPIEIYGDGNQIMDMVYIDDVATALVDALEIISEVPEMASGLDHPFDAGSAVPTTVNDIAETIREYSPETEIRHLPMRPGEEPGAVVIADPERYVPGWKPTVDLTEGIHRTVDWYRETWLPTWK